MPQASSTDLSIHTIAAGKMATEMTSLAPKQIQTRSVLEFIMSQPDLTQRLTTALDLPDQVRLFRTGKTTLIVDGYEIKVPFSTSMLPYIGSLHVTITSTMLSHLPEGPLTVSGCTIPKMVLDDPASMSRLGEFIKHLHQRDDPTGKSFTIRLSEPPSNEFRRTLAALWPARKDSTRTNLEIYCGSFKPASVLQALTREVPLESYLGRTSYDWVAVEGDPAAKTEMPLERLSTEIRESLARCKNPNILYTIASTGSSFAMDGQSPSSSTRDAAELTVGNGWLPQLAMFISLRGPDAGPPPQTLVTWRRDGDTRCAEDATDMAARELAYMRRVTTDWVRNLELITPYMLESLNDAARQSEGPAATVFNSPADVRARMHEAINWAHPAEYERVKRHIQETPSEAYSPLERVEAAEPYESDDESSDGGSDHGQGVAAVENL
jgi:hypothetical protein